MKWRLMQHSGVHAQGSVLPEGVMGSNGSEEFFPYFLLHKDPGPLLVEEHAIFG